MNGPGVEKVVHTMYYAKSIGRTMEICQTSLLYHTSKNGGSICKMHATFWIETR
jgi:hypothetical protein